MRWSLKHLQQQCRCKKVVGIGDVMVLMCKMFSFCPAHDFDYSGSNRAVCVQSSRLAYPCLENSWLKGSSLEAKLCYSQSKPDGKKSKASQSPWRMRSDVWK